MSFTIWESILEDEDTWDIMITLAPTSFTAPKMALAVPGTPAIPVLQKNGQGAVLIVKEIKKKVDNYKKN